jgi:hypothetical protein
MVLRKRASAVDNHFQDDSSISKSFFESLKEYDAYSKPLDDFRVKTSSGAAG